MLVPLPPHASCGKPLAQVVVSIADVPVFSHLFLTFCSSDHALYILFMPQERCMDKLYPSQDIFTFYDYGLNIGHLLLLTGCKPGHASSYQALCSGQASSHEILYSQAFGRVLPT